MGGGVSEGPGEPMRAFGVLGNLREGDLGDQGGF